MSSETSHDYSDEFGRFVEYRERRSHSLKIIAAWVAIGVVGVLLALIPNPQGPGSGCHSGWADDQFRVAYQVCAPDGIVPAMILLAFLGLWASALLVWRMLWLRPGLLVGELGLQNRMSFFWPWRIAGADVDHVGGPVRTLLGRSLTVYLKEGRVRHPWDSVSRRVPLSNLSEPPSEIEDEIWKRLNLPKAAAPSRLHKSRPTGLALKVRAQTQDETLDEITAADLFALLEEMRPGDFLILDRPESDPYAFIQAASGKRDWRVEYRERESEPLHGTDCPDVSQVYDVLLSWAHDDADWRDRMPWQPADE